MEFKSMLRVMLALIFLAEFASAEIGKPCQKQSDCDHHTECCIKRLLSDKSICAPKFRKDTRCMIPYGGTSMVNGKYEFMCPCEAGTECIEDIYYNDRNEVMYKHVPMCRDTENYQPPNVEVYLNNPEYIPFGGRQHLPSNNAY